MQVLPITRIDDNLQGANRGVPSQIHDRQAARVPSATITKSTLAAKSCLDILFLADSPGPHEKTPCSIRPRISSTQRSPGSVSMNWSGVFPPRAFGREENHRAARFSSSNTSTARAYRL